MIYISEAVAEQLVSIKDAIAAVEGAFAALGSGEAEAFPVASARGFHDSQRWAVKSGMDRRGKSLGFKVGSYWPGNAQLGLPAHGSTVVLLDPETGFADAIVAATYLTALRTAAADAIGVKYLSRPDSATLAVIGAGHQALWDVRAIAEVRKLTEVRVAGPTARKVDAFVRTLRDEGIPARAASAADAVQDADIIITVTPSTSPVLEAGWLKAGSHVSAMGADSYGKQELPHELLTRAELFCDIATQSATIGEFQSGVRANIVEPQQITSIGAVITGAAPGRGGSASITIFDSSGTALQDLAICALTLELAKKSGRAIAI